MVSRIGRLALVAALVLICHASPADDWLRFRGPNGSGVSMDKATTPEKWSPTENLKWKAKLPGPGVSSPIVVGDRVFVTSYSGYGVSRGAGSLEDLKRHLVCIDANTGQELWSKAVQASLPEDSYSGIGVTAHGYASHTPVSDGKRVYSFFGKSGVVAFDLEGKQLWQVSVGTGSDPRRWGSSSSPIVYKDKVIVTAAAESNALVALNAETGAEEWRSEADGFDNVWGTPVLAKIDDERTDIVLGVPYEIWGFNPDTGKLAWYCLSMETDQYQSSVVIDDGVIYGIEGRGGGSIAVKAGGKGDITDDNVVWTGRDSARYCTPVVYEGNVYFVSNGIANGIEAKTGKKLFQARLGGGDAGGGSRGGFGRGGGGDYSSPVIADGKLYYVKSNGETYVLKLGDKLETLASNHVTEDSESFGGTPAISNGRIFIRSDKHIYCIAKEQ